MNEKSMQQLSEVYRNSEALAVAHDICAVLNFWDALALQRSVTGERMNQCMWMALVSIPRNKFWREHFDELHPQLMSVINDWQAALQIELQSKASKAQLERAYTCRQSYLSLLVKIAALAHGSQYAAAVGPVIREILDDGGQKKYIDAWKARPIAPSAPPAKS